MGFETKRPPWKSDVAESVTVRLISCCTAYSVSAACVLMAKVRGRVTGGEGLQECPGEPVCVYSSHRGALSTDKAQGVKSLRTFLGSTLNMRVASKKHHAQLLKLFQHYLLIIILAGLDVFQPAN